MSTAPRPSTGDTVVDTRVMNLLHTYYRREQRLASGLVRAVNDGDTHRAHLVADHLDMVGRHLHHHHNTEDELMWPLLLRRVPDELAPIVHLMESQHGAVDAVQQQIAAVLPTWRAHAGAHDRDRLAELFDTLYLHLAEHLDAEEQRLLPIAARTLTQDEWERMGEAGRKGTPRPEMLVTLGMYAYDGDPEVLASMLAGAPAPVRWLVPRLARRAFRKHARRIHGTPTP